MKTEGGGISYANLYFEPDKWSDAYKNQKKCGFVFAPRKFAAAVSLASHICLFERCGAIIGEESSHLCKMGSRKCEKWVQWLSEAKKLGMR